MLGTVAANCLSAVCCCSFKDVEMPMVPGSYVVEVSDLIGYVWVRYVLRAGCGGDSCHSNLFLDQEEESVQRPTCTGPLVIIQ